jgi:hypothetical protein
VLFPTAEVYFMIRCEQAIMDNLALIVVITESSVCVSAPILVGR